VFTPQPMRHVRLLVLAEDLPRVSITLAAMASFQPDPRPLFESEFPGVPGRHYRELYQQARSRLDKICRLIPIPEGTRPSDIRVVEAAELDKLNLWLGEIWNECSTYEEEFRKLNDDERLLNEQENALANFANLDVDLGTLRTKTRFLDFYVGIVPRANLRQLEGAVGLAEHLLFPFLVSGSQAHVVIVGPRGVKEAQLSAVLDAAGFQHLPIPSGMAREPSKIHEELSAHRAEIRDSRANLQDTLGAWGAGFKERLAEARNALALAEPFVELDPSIRSFGQLAVVAGWMPARAVPDLDERLRGNLLYPFQIEARAPRPDERAFVPTLTRRGPLLAPFATLVKQYGIPRYGEIDPTPLFAVTFILMFGSMFGDVGQGAVIALTAWLLRRKLKRFALFGVLAGLSSVAFGFLFGSVFGYEHILHPLWVAPLSDPIYMLGVALGWGVVFLITACLLTVYNRLALGHYLGAVFEHHGIVNLVFYLALLGGALQLYRGGELGWVPAALVITSLLALAAFRWRGLAAPTGEKILVVAIETLETVIGYVSNTLSFLRVAAFSLNHVALSIAIFTLAEMLGTLGHWITVVLGNLFILVLEGGIVMIQVMRLEYYEGFSRYFFGDGHEFSPLRLRAGAE